MDTTLLRRFVTTAEATNWGAAAKTLNMTRATLLISIRTLEDEVGGELFVTVDDVPTLTRAGVELLEVARPLVRKPGAAAAPKAAVKAGGKAKASKGQGRAPAVKGAPKAKGRQSR
ncbi:DNA-binding transcriptional LysR family regulator [Cryobacterium sp. MP_M5]|uniref:LysR family transcriptional regulator n=1 Tax=unclassified Cryobacterium TaxID=2649013 RepID=UPI0018CB7E57|nr:MULTISPECIES: LysR family transcriptional regulator [unclassified Cryobacterium]MBG6057289.1 DNA-binding transcriptional LysR family regulator [Cryobacterium sp. MP_M3]MEC5175488.1 DNA-binding transcriptional LysR family regulator [Cryobacterium sp. MP_M5]